MSRKVGETLKVYLQKCDTYSDSNRVLRNILDEFSGDFRAGERVLVKANMLSPRPAERAVTTRAEIVRGVLKFLLEMGTKPFVADSPAVGSAVKVAQACGIMEVCQELSVPVIDLNNPIKKDGQVYKRINISSVVFDADKVVNIAKLKTHAQMVLTLGVKNTFGCVPGLEKSRWHVRCGTNENFAKLLVDVHLLVNPVLTVIDGVEGMEGDGPSNGEKKRFGLIAASKNAFALDHAIAARLGVKPESVYTINESMQRKLIEKYEVVGDWEGSIKLPSTSHVLPIPGFLKKIVRSTVRVPKINKRRCVSCRICEKRCPVHAIDIDAHRVDTRKCIRCYVCHEVCPENAIRLVVKIL